MDRRNFIRILGGGVILAATAATGSLKGCSTGMPPEAIAAWRRPVAENDPRRWILSHAILAPNPHNLQSWLVDLSVPDEITLHCDLTRLLPETDPYSRQIMMSQGTFLELLDMASRERGMLTDIKLFPAGVYASDKPDSRPVARIRLEKSANVKRDPLFGQIFERHTNREDYLQRSISPQMLNDVVASAGMLIHRAGFATAERPALFGRLREIAKKAYRTELITPRTLLESYRLLRIGPDEISRYRDGIAMNQLLPRVMVSLGLFDRSKPSSPDDMAITQELDRFNASIDSTPAFFWLVTEGNSRTAQINAGRAYVRAQLAATAHGLSMQPLSQALQEYREQATSYAEIHRLLGALPPTYTVQMLARTGYAPRIGPAPRKTLESHILGMPSPAEHAQRRRNRSA